jgi:hypothetical protein
LHYTTTTPEGQHSPRLPLGMEWHDDSMADETQVYLDLVRNSSRPTDDQIRSFAHFVSTDHSWYKHLPIGGRGEPFFFYLDPHVHEEFVEIAPGARAWRSIVREEAGAAQIPGFAIAYEDGDIPNETLMGLNYLARRNTTAQWRNRFGLFSYWNHGPPDQPSDEAIESARHALRYGDDQGAARAIPLEVLERGLVYLRATVYPGRFTSIEDEAERISNGLPSADADRETQVDEMIQSMRLVVDWVYDSD